MRTIHTHMNAYRDLLQSGDIYVEDAEWGLCHVNVVPEGQSGRQDHGGDQVPGPWAFTTAHAGVIDNFGGSAREAEQAIKVKLGEPFKVEGLPGTWAFRNRNVIGTRLEGDGVQLAPLDDEAVAVAYQ